MKKFTIMLALLLFAVSQGAFAQRTITGKAINGEDGLPMPGVSVVVKGTTITTQTNTAGNFSITVPNNRATIVVSFVGFKTVEIPVGNNTQFTITLQPDPIALGEVVVSARRNNEPEKVVTIMGIERDPISLPYTVRHISGDVLRSSGFPSIAVALAKNIPDIGIRTIGQGAGAPEMLTNRGRLITLYMIDGIAVNARTVTVLPNGMRETEYYDINYFVNILDIESVTFIPQDGTLVITSKKR